MGYEDPGFFSRRFRGQVTLTSAQYRKHFSAMRRATRDGGERARAVVH
jgi:AraC-like DNA-binding protein